MTLPAPLEKQQLDSPTEEQLKADWLSQLVVGEFLAIVKILQLEANLTRQKILVN